METIGSYDAKTHLPKLLQRAENGEKITITRNGRPVAMLVPPPPAKVPDVEAAIARMLEIRKGRTLDGITIRELIEEGRRY